MKSPTAVRLLAALSTLVEDAAPEQRGIELVDERLVAPERRRQVLAPRAQAERQHVQEQVLLDLLVLEVERVRDQVGRLGVARRAAARPAGAGGRLS